MRTVTEFEVKTTGTQETRKCTLETFSCDDQSWTDLAQDCCGTITVLTQCKYGSLQRAARFIFATVMIIIREAREVLEGQEQDGVQLKQHTFFQSLINCFSIN